MEENKGTIIDKDARYNYNGDILLLADIYIFFFFSISTVCLIVHFPYF